MAEWSYLAVGRISRTFGHHTGRRDICRGLRRDRRTCVSLQDFEQWRPADLGFYVPRRQNGASQLAAQGNCHGIFTLGPTTIARIDRDRLIGEIIDHPNVTIALWWNALQREAILRERITAIGRRDAYARVAHLLCEMFQRLRLVGETVDQRYMLPVTQAEMGDALGISEVYANRMLRRLQNEKLIVYDQRVVRIPDLDALKHAAEFDGQYLHLDGAPQAVRDAVSTQRLMP